MASRQSSESELEVVQIEPTTLLKNYKGISKETVRESNRYYSEYGAEYLV